MMNGNLDQTNENMNLYVPATYTLFEEKPYLTLLKEKTTQQFEEILRIKEKRLMNRLQKIEEEIIDQLVLQIYNVNPDFWNELSLKLGDKEKFEDKLKIIDEFVREKNINLQLTDKITDLIYKWKQIKEEIEELKNTKKELEDYKETLNNLIELLEVYPKHLRFGFLGEEEIKAIRYITDFYFLMLTKGILLEETRYFNYANFLILPLIINIEETSLSREAFFLRVIHSAPLVNLNPTEEQEIPVNLIEKQMNIEKEKINNLEKEEQNKGKKTLLHKVI